MVRLDKTGDHVGRGTLGRDDKVYARRTSKLRQARNGEFDLFAHVHHEIGKLVDDDDDIGQLFEHLSVLRVLLSCLLALLSLRIVLTNVARTKAREHFEPTLHFSDRPRERTWLLHALRSQRERRDAGCRYRE